MSKHFNHFSFPPNFRFVMICLIHTSHRNESSQHELGRFDHLLNILAAIAALYVTMSVGRLVRRSVGRSATSFKIVNVMNAMLCNVLNIVDVINDVDNEFQSCKCNECNAVQCS